VQQLLPDARVLDVDKVGEVLMDIKPGLPATDNFQHCEPEDKFGVDAARLNGIERDFRPPYDIVWLVLGQR
jgi:hypothetical protein